jgi:N-acetylglucosamine kinase-like BadF-type ATPase
MSPPEPAAVYSIDAGGSRTVVALWKAGAAAGTSVHESFAIASTGLSAARQSLARILDELRSQLPDHPVALGCIASSSMPVAGEAPLPQSLLDVIATHAPRGRVVAVNDVVPLLWSSPLNGAGIVVCSGTGSSVLGRDAAGRQRKVGGHEHIISDAGSAYSIGRRGLRAAARDADLTGASTKLRPTAESFFERPIPAVGRWLAELPRARSTVASFAPAVIRLAEDGDPVAQAIVEGEAAALADAVAVAAAALSLGPMPTIGLAGGVHINSAHFRSLVGAALEKRDLTDGSRGNIHQVTASEAGAEYARRLADANGTSLPDGEVLEISETAAIRSGQQQPSPGVE